MAKVYVNPDVCMGCGLCSVYCQVEHSPSKDVLKAFKSGDPKPAVRIRIEREGPCAFSIQCRHCDEPWCVYSCLTGAMRRNEQNGEVEYDADRCIGCWTCVMVCPNGILARDTESHLIAKCDLCPDRQIPACVTACPNEALVMITDDGQKITASPQDDSAHAAIID